MVKQIVDYIEAKKDKWAKTTIEKEASRLNAHAKLVELGPKAAYYKLKEGGMKPYAIKTTMIRLGDFELFCFKTVTFKEFLATHANLFKYAYQSERVDMTFEEAQERIEQIPDVHTRMAARQLLEAGLRSCELPTVKNERVIGKGGKPRDVYLSADLKKFVYKGTYWQLYKALRKVGLKPHMLRKLCATQFARQDGVHEIDLMESFGWSDFDTAKRYLQPLVSERRSRLFKQVVGK